MYSGAPQRIATYCGPISVSSMQHGGPGTPGATAVVDDDAVPRPTLFTALTLNTYRTPLVRPVTVVERSVDTTSVNVVQLDPESDE